MVISLKNKIILYIIIFSIALVVGFSNKVKADEYTKAVIAHVVTQKDTGNNIDSSKSVSYTHLTLPPTPYV